MIVVGNSSLKRLFKPFWCTGTLLVWCCFLPGICVSQPAHTDPSSAVNVNTLSPLGAVTSATTLNWAKLVSSGTPAKAETIGLPAPIHGVTIADDRDIRTQKYLNQVISALENLSVTPTVRFVFTLEMASGTQGASANSYLSAIQQVKSSTNRNTKAHPYVLGFPVDSSAMYCFSVAEHRTRWKDFVDTLNPYVDVWEVGNEINGNWLYSSGPGANVSGQSCPQGWRGGIPSTTIQDVADKMADAFKLVKAAGKPAALTLTFCPTDLPATNDPFRWVDTYATSSALRNGMDYVFISYYSDAVSCKYGLPKEADWVNWFTGIQSRFPNAKVGLGEWGYGTKQPPDNLKTVLEEGYRLNPSVMLPKPDNWVGGVFYWEFGVTAVPHTGKNQLGTSSNWSDVNDDLQKQH
jgi:hypothetical protein